MFIINIKKKEKRKKEKRKKEKRKKERRERERGEGEGEGEGEDPVEEMCLFYCFPGESEWELVENGKNVPVTCKNVEKVFNFFFFLIFFFNFFF